MNALRENQTWVLVPRPVNRKVINNRRFYRQKKNES